MPVIASLERANRGHHLRGYGLHQVQASIDPFRGIDHAWMNASCSPPRVHAGLSAVSYVFLDSETGLCNRDSFGSSNIIRPGGVQWTTAGRGIIQEEVPADAGKTVHALQVLVNLAPARQLMAPSTASLEPQEVPVLFRPGIKIRVPVGQFDTVVSPLKPPTEVTLLDVSLEEGAELVVPVPAGQCAFAVPIFGMAVINGQRFDHNDLRLPVFPAQQQPQSVVLQARHCGAKVVLLAGIPVLTTIT